VEAHLAAEIKASGIGFGRCIISASTPFEPEELPELRVSSRRAQAISNRSSPKHSN
jgi:UDP-glucose 4-epimerase